MPWDHDDILSSGEEVQKVPGIDLTPGQEKERDTEFELDKPAVLQTLEGRELNWDDILSGNKSSWLQRASFPFFVCLIFLSAFLVLYFIIR